MPVSPSRRKKIIAQRPVRLTGVVLSVLLFLNVKLFGDGAPAYVEIITFIAPVIAALIAERFTFSQSFMRGVIKIIDQYGGNREGLADRIVRQDPRLNDGTRARGTNYLAPRDRGVSTIEVLLVLIILIVLLFILLPGHR